MVPRVDYQRLEERKERGWNALAERMGAAWERLDELEYYDWLDAESAIQEVVEKVVAGRKRHYLPPTVANIAATMRKVGHGMHVRILAAALERRRILAPPSVLLRVLEENVAPGGPFTRGRNYRFGLACGDRDAARSPAPHP